MSVMIARTMIAFLCGACLSLPATVFAQTPPTLVERIEQSIAKQHPTWKIVAPFPRLRTGSAPGWIQGRWDDSGVIVWISLRPLDSPAAAAKEVDMTLRLPAVAVPTRPVAFGDRGFLTTSASGTGIVFNKHNIWAQVFAMRSPTGDVPATVDVAAHIVDAAITGPVTMTECVNELSPDSRGAPRTVDERLFRAAESGCVPVFRAALSSGANPNTHGGRSNWPVLAVAGRNLDMVRSLLKAGADPNARDDWGATPVFHAPARTGVLETLIAAGADVNARDLSGQTALIDACRVWSFNGYEVMALIAHGADLNARDANGWTALTHTIDLLPGSPATDERIEILIAAGADVNAKGPLGTPLEMLTELEQRTARVRLPPERNVGAVRRMLVEAGAK